MRRRTNENQKIMDRAREARRERISGERERESHAAMAGSGVVSEAEDGGKSMIRVTRLSGEVLYLNVLQIESIESIPETKIKMMNGYYFLVKDSIDSIQEQIRAFINSCIVLSGKGE